MVMESIEKIMSNLGAADIDSRLEEQLIDGILYAFQEQTTEVWWQSLTLLLEKKKLIKNLCGILDCFSISFKR